MAPLAVADITPTLEQVASYIRTLTRGTSGGEQGTFNDQTRPDQAEATVIALRAARYVALQIGTPNTTWGADLLASATDAAANYAALQIATSFFDDGSETIAALIDQLGRMSREQVTALVKTAQSNAPGGWRIHSIEQITDCTPADDTDPDDMYALIPATPDEQELLPHQIANGPDLIYEDPRWK